ncbi:uncharacterized protein LOC111000734 [Pieris rapae]|uniref:uncharacterized protein LOC111000734 n=1 Tax=Pieris rapae TaxID=64459 RepID=UPI000B92900F|nr:uncharacterized protein LOC111000734 [Pieris rapae]
MSAFTTINCLPIEIFIEIFIKIDGYSLLKCREVCKKWKEAIDNTDILWQEVCRKEFKKSSRIAKKKSGDILSWYHVYRNLKLWSNVSSYEKTVREFYKFNLHDPSHVLGINYGVLPLKDAKGTVFYDMTDLKYIPVALPEKNYLKISNNDHATVIQVKFGIYVQRTLKDPNYITEYYFKADKYVLNGDLLLFYNNKDVYKCNLLQKELTPHLILHCNYDIKEIQYYDAHIYLFTDCGRILNLESNNSVTEKTIKCPAEWIVHIKNINAFDDKNFICYSRTLFKIETDDYQHLYLDFPPITALFFYIDIVLIGLRNGSVLVYRLTSQKKAMKPVFETLAELPDGKFPVQLDVCERRTGPMIVAATFFELYMIDVKFFPCETTVKNSFTNNKLNMYQRLRRLKERLQ